MSAEKIGFPFNVRLIIANNVSNIGIAKIVIGTKKEVSAGPLNSNREIIANYGSYKVGIQGLLPT